MDILLIGNNAADIKALTRSIRSVPGEHRTIFKRLNLQDSYPLIKEDHFFDYIFIDYDELGQENSVSLQEFSQIFKRSTRVLLVAEHEVPMARQAIKHGVDDYLIKGHYEIDCVERLMRYTRERSDFRLDPIDDPTSFLHMLSQLPGMSFRCKNDKDWTMSRLGSGCAAITGYQPDEIIGNQRISYNDLIHPEDRLQVWESVQKASVHNRPYLISYRIIHRNGGIRVVWEQGRAVLHNQQVCAIEGYISDVTEIETIRTTLEQTKQGMHALMKSFDDVVFTLDTQERHSAVYGRWLENMNISAEDFLGKTAFDFFGEQGKIHHKANLQALQGERVIYEWTMGDAGKKQFFQTSLSPIYDSNQTITGIAGVARDITSLKKAEETFKRYALLFENTRDILLVIHLDDGKILDANPKAVEVYGYDRDELLSKTIMDLQCAHNHAQVLSNLQLEFDHGLLFESKHQRKDGTAFPVEINSRGDTIQGEKILISIIRDISARKEAQEKLDYVQKMMQSVSDSISTEICVLDQSGEIVAVNEAWREFASMNADGHTPGVDVGVNYLEVCRKAAIAGSNEAKQALNGITRILNAEQTSFEMEYGCDSPNEKRWFVMQVSPLSGQNTGAVITHINITAQKKQEIENEAIAGLMKRIKTAVTREELLPIILQQAQDLLSCSEVAIGQLNSNADSFTVELALGEWEQARTKSFSLDAECPFIQSLVYGKYLHLQDTNAYNYFLPDDFRDHAENTLVLPLTAFGEIIGTLWLSRKNRYSEQDLQVVETFAEIAANLLHRAKLFEQAQKRYNNLCGLQHIEQSILSTKDSNQTLEIILEEIKKNIRSDAVLIYDTNWPKNGVKSLHAYGFKQHESIFEWHEHNNHHKICPLEQKKLIAIEDLDQYPDFVNAHPVANEDFVSYYGIPIVQGEAVKAVIELYFRKYHELDEEELEFLEALANQASIAMENADLYKGLINTNQKLFEAYDSTIMGWAQTMALHDEETVGHTQRVAQISVLIAQHLGLDQEALNYIRWGALLHDIGKASIPDEILHKPGPLTDEEWVIMKTHPTLAFNALSPIEFLRPALDIPYCHHEHWDGSGYPLGLKGEEIPLAARIFTVTDVWDALTSDRSYRKAWSNSQALHYILENSGKLFDPMIVDVFHQLIKLEIIL